MNPSNFAPRTDSAPLCESILEIRPTQFTPPSGKGWRPGPGSGSLGEFIEKKTTPSVFISRIAIEVKERVTVNQKFSSFSSTHDHTKRFHFVFLAANSMFPGVTPRRRQSSA